MPKITAVNVADTFLTPAIERPRWDLLRWWRAAAAIVLVLGSAAGLIGAWVWHVTLARQEQTNFNQAAFDVKATAANSLAHYDDLVGTLASVFTPTNPPTRPEFASLVRDLDLSRRYPGVFGVGFVTSVHEADLASFLRSTRKGIPNYTVFPPRPAPRYCLGSYAAWSAPTTPHLPLLGLNLCAYSFLEQALDRARDTGQEAVIAGSALGTQWASDFAFVAPVYAGQPATTSARRTQLTGWVAGLVDGNELARATLSSPRIGVELFTGAGTSARMLVLSTLPTKGPTARGVRAETFHLVTESIWTLRVLPLGGSWAANSVLVPAVALVLALVGNLMLALFIASLGYTRLLALRRVERTTKSLRESHEQFMSLAANAPLGILRLTEDGNATYVNARMTEITGRETADLLGRGWLTAIDQDASQRFFDLESRARDEQRVLDTDLHLRRPDGETRRVRLLSAPIVSDLGVTTGWVLNVHDMTEEAAARDALAFQALHDPLTGLPNKALFLDLVERGLVRRGVSGEVAVLLMDLDNFHRINDSLGHQSGDEVILEVANRLSGTLRADETVARLGGDVFTLLIENITDVSAAVRVALRVTEALSSPFVVGPDRHEAVVSASIGIVVADRKAGAEAALRDADTAMNRAKATGRAHYEVFEKEQYVRSLERLTLEGELRRAIDRGELLLHYQPVFSLSTDALIGAEALVRWEHPTRGLLAPIEFIPLAEETGLIVPLGEKVTRAALDQLAAWDSPECTLQVPLLAVNFSAVQLARWDFGSRVGQALSDSGVDPGRLCAEITETVLMANNETTRASVAELKRLGVRIAIDDFGTGYSSLAYLEELPAEILKIDRRFVSGLGPEDAVAGTIVRAVVAIAHALGLTVVAEGVEEHGQFEFLRRCGCDSGQGYLWARPMPAEEFATWAEQRERFLERSTEFGTSLVARQR